MKTRRIPVLIGVFLGSLLVATVFFATKSSAQGMMLISLEDKAAGLEAQNQELKTQIVSSSSLLQIGKEAKNLKMGSPEKFVYLSNQVASIR